MNELLSKPLSFGRQFVKKKLSLALKHKRCGSMLYRFRLADLFPRLSSLANSQSAIRVILLESHCQKSFQFC